MAQIDTGVLRLLLAYNLGQIGGMLERRGNDPAWHKAASGALAVCTYMANAIAHAEGVDYTDVLVACGMPSMLKTPIAAMSDTQFDFSVFATPERRSPDESLLSAQLRRVIKQVVKATGEGPPPGVMRPDTDIHAIQTGVFSALAIIMQVIHTVEDVDLDSLLEECDFPLLRDAVDETRALVDLALAEGKKQLS